ncbi:hypothetical protein EMIHUDRAFT_460010 [Emiliania huxleyi CCMP1516]|uniref:non-specific serine/threonine protein kinase n=2 Tax=Emiliania huxleyi TaxID=2903 RepID=A0A0D3I9W8_EMIH1|nr:hypothetical protein EMIHUDRAFT_460010 [Emiliania huxleyi CCMP1516]EOD08053.1 hypothetical protein EMIHUDRAFT_460010 [Emiliania huxleyi CCMP1516]|eukprot:XP_005760482.1 hypothetical protein EMIHUDRAFT_460010 [Emiliania huxleyi CCMP1516]
MTEPPARFRVLREVGRGAQGRVLLVQHNESGEKYVLKQIPISEKNAAAAVGEVNVLSRLSHPNITTLYDAWRAGSQLNILMEFADRGSLAEVIKTKQATGTLFDEDVVLDWLVQITAALRAMHALSILHRDLKAANVFLTSRNLIKVGDFGISKILERNDGLASTTIGTPYYLAPEVINGEPYGLKADVWSLGATSLPSLALKIVATTYPPPPEQFSPELRAVLASMLQREPSARPSLDQLSRLPLEKKLQAELRRIADTCTASALPPAARAEAASSGAVSGRVSERGTPPAALSPADDLASSRQSRRVSGSKEARQHAMRMHAEEAPPLAEPRAGGAAALESTQQLGHINEEENLRFRLNLEAIEINLATQEARDPESTKQHTRGAMMPLLDRKNALGENHSM